MPLRENDDAELQLRHAPTKSRQGQNLGSQRRLEQRAPSLLPSSELFLSAIELRFEKPEFEAAIIPYPGDEEFQKLRTRDDCFAYRRRGLPGNQQVLLIPVAPSLIVPVERLGRLEVCHHLNPLARLIEWRLPLLLPKLSLQRARWGLVSARHDEDLVSRAFEGALLMRPAKLNLLRKFHRAELRVRRETLPGRGSLLFLTVEFSREHSIEGSVSDLLELGLRLNGLAAYAEEAGAKKQRGTIVRADGSRLIMIGQHGEMIAPAARCRLEPSAETFRHLFGQALSIVDLEKYENADWMLRAGSLSGRNYLNRLDGWVSYLGRCGALPVTDTLRVTFHNVLTMPRTGKTTASTVLEPIDYCFSMDGIQTHRVPSEGLDQHGPFDSRTFPLKSPRILIICPTDARHLATPFIRRLLEGMAKDGKQRFAGGLSGTYRLDRVFQELVTVDLPKQSIDVVGQRYLDALKAIFDRAHRPDIVLVLIRDEDAFIDRGNPYLAAKAFLLSQGIPSQEVRLSKVKARIGDLPFILEDIALGMYAKMGGCPWTIRPVDSHVKEVILGMAYAEFGERFSARRRYMSITTVFKTDGTYLLAAGSPRCTYEEYPAMLAKSVRDLLSRLVQEQGWKDGDVIRLVFHAPKPLTGREVESIRTIALQTLGTKITFESAFLTIERDHPLKAVDPRELGKERFVELSAGGKGKALVAEYVPRRGTILNLGQRKRLLCVSGPLLVRREGEPIPQPLQIELHPDSTYGNLDVLTRQVFDFTGLSWRSMRPVSEPVTIYYSRLIAKLLGRLDGHPLWSDTLLDTHLRMSRWFL